MQSGEKLLVEAYAVIWVLVFGMLLFSWRRQKKMDERIAGLEQAVTAARRTAANRRPPTGRRADARLWANNPAARDLYPERAAPGACDGLHPRGSRGSGGARPAAAQDEGVMEERVVDFALSDEHKALIEAARRFTKERIIPIAAECDRESRFPMDVFKEAWELGLVNVTCPAEYGGPGMGEVENSLMVEELAYGCTGIQTSILANVLALTPIKLGGSEEQKKKYLGMLAASRLWRATRRRSPTPGATWRA
jgi:CcmD family protein